MTSHAAQFILYLRPVKSHTLGMRLTHLRSTSCSHTAECYCHLWNMSGGLSAHCPPSLPDKLLLNLSPYLAAVACRPTVMQCLDEDRGLL